jgi:uncharacterized protein (DUF1810 family)
MMRDRPLSDPYDLQRFVDAQRGVFAQAEAELRQGRKRGHWMWFMFPQLRGLGHSDLATRFALASLEEAQAYLDHPVLGPRLRECSRLVTLIEGRPVADIFGYPDSLKFRSSMTLFARATDDNQVFMDAVRKYYGGEFDRLTLERL